MSTPILLPGTSLPSSILPRPNKSGTLTLGPGLRHTPPQTIITTSLGTLSTDPKKSALWLENLTGRYSPSVNDLVIAQIHHSSTDTYSCTLTPHTPFALLGQLSFEGASKKTRPQLKSGDLVYARVCKAGRGEDVEIECLN
ncbi:exosome non-catalytic core subunit rrp40, partial [Oleoguttula sp. CCFEE 5521]